MYFDNASTTRPTQAVLEENARINREIYGNPASLHSMGVLAEGEIIAATKKLSGLLGVSGDEIIYTSGGTEANNLAVFGVCGAGRRRGKRIVTTRSEHPSVSEACKHLEQKGFEVIWLKTDTEGMIDISDLTNAVNEGTILVSLMHVNNETGTVCDIERAGAVIKAKNPSTVFHSDGVQAFGKLKPDLKNVDLYSMSAHKIHALRGAGALYVKKSVRVVPQIYGGGQQRGMRSGTENTAGVCTFALAAGEMYRKMDAGYAHVSRLKAMLMGVADELDGVFVNGSGDGSPYMLNMSFTGVRAEVLLHCLETDGIYVSTGSACGSKSSHNILGHYGLEQSRVESALRFSFSHDNTPEEVETVKKALVTHVRALRSVKK